MTYEEMERSLNEWWIDCDAEALRRKDAQSSVLALIDRFAALPVIEQNLAAAVMGTWVVSEDAVKRFAALAVVEEFALLELLPQLRRLETILSPRPGPEPHYELLKVRRAIRALEEARDGHGA